VAVLSAGAAARADTFVVTNTADPGDGVCGSGCTLREAIDAANANPGVDFIEFDIPGGGPHVIRPVTPLPNITENVSIDGSSQPGFAGTPLIEIAGDLAGPGADGLRILAEFCQVGWLAVNRFDRDGIYIGPPGSVTVVGCHVGVDASGTIDRGNGQDGIEIWSPDNHIGGTQPSLRNVISGNGMWGIVVTFQNATGNVIEGNYIGLDRTGAAAISNGADGGLVDGGIILKYAGPGNRIGGTAQGAGNVISGNADLGISLFDDPGATPGADVVQGNLIGTDASGLVAVPNGAGVYVTDDGCTVGGALEHAGNTIAGHPGTAIHLSQGHDSRVRGNRIGVNAAGAPLGNGWGIWIHESDDCKIGGTGAYSANVVAYSNEEGVVVDAGTGNEISVNSIHSNGELGIDLDADGVTPNDALDADGGPNDRQNCPDILSAERSVDGTQLVVTVFVESKPSNWYRVRYYANDACDPSGSGEGETYLGSALTFTDASGHFTGTHTITLGPSVALTDEITATATDMATFDTSEFSPCQAVDSAACAPTAGSCYIEHAGVGCRTGTCCNVICDLDAFCCQTGWDPLCAQEAAELCGDCGSFGAGPCHLNNGTPGCYEDGCCAAVCALDDFCCNTNWDVFCAELARANCTLACLADCALPVDGVIDVTDLLQVLGDWGSPGPCDTDDNGAIDVTDLLEVLGGWGPCL
jgi:CSLREA domain-containing protein